MRKLILLKVLAVSGVIIVSGGISDAVVVEIG